jgi:predicted glutamine amidotransferase
MCRLFFSLTKSSRNNEPKRQLLNFFDKCEQQDIKDGFGMCWYNDNDWHTYKKPLHYRDDPHIFKKVDNISSKVILAHARNINKTNVPKHRVEKERCLENTHPISYKETIFMHHGDLLLETQDGLKGYQRFKHLPEFKRKIKETIALLDASLLKDMKGNTDSELLMFLFLSVKKNVELENPKVNEEDLIAHSFKKTVKLIKDTKLVNRSNIILAHDDYILIAKIIKNDSKFIAGGLDIYVDIIPDGIIISSCKLSQSAKNMKSNTAIIVNHKKNTINTINV